MPEETRFGSGITRCKYKHPPGVFCVEATKYLAVNHSMRNTANATPLPQSYPKSGNVVLNILEYLSLQYITLAFVDLTSGK